MRGSGSAAEGEAGGLRVGSVVPVPRPFLRYELSPFPNATEESSGSGEATLVARWHMLSDGAAWSWVRVKTRMHG